MLEVRGVSVDFQGIVALDGVDFSIAAGETVGLVGESGSGKSTLARAVLRLVQIRAGAMRWDGDDMLAWRGARLRAHRRDMQMVFQDPLASLNPRMSVAAALAEPLRIFEPALPAAARTQRIEEMLERVGLSAAAAARFPHEFSGGQCQRIGIARAMMNRPRLLVCDEPVSSLDVSVQGQIVNLLQDLQREFGMAILFISHNMSVVRHMSHRVLVLYRGRLVESAARDALFGAPAHPYTRVLLESVPPHPRTVQLAKATPNVPALAAPALSAGCVFVERCVYAQPSCTRVIPLLQMLAPGHAVACRRATEI